MIDRTLDLSSRGFFGAASAALVAAVAPKRAYSFLTANPLAAATWRGVPFPFAGVDHPAPNWAPVANANVDGVLMVTSAEQMQRIMGGSVRDWQHWFEPRPVIMVHPKEVRAAK